MNQNRNKTGIKGQNVLHAVNVQRFAMGATLLLAMTGLVSCRVLGPDIDTGRAEALPALYRATGANGIVLTNAWWKEFAHSEIERLVEQAFEGNLTLAQSAARLRQVRATAGRIGAAGVPQISASAEAATTHRKTSGADNQGAGSAGEQDAGSGTTRVETYGLGLAASYELDLWGRVHAVTESAQTDAAAARLDLETAAMTVAAQVVDLWLELVEARLQRELLRSQIETNRRMLELLRKRVGKSSTRVIDVYQQEQSMLALEAALPVVDQRVAILENELPVLLGLPAGTDLGIQSMALPLLPPRPSAGIPGDVLMLRPDVRAEYLRMEGAGWDVAAARADRLPALRLTARASTEAEEFGSLFDNWLANLAAGLTAPLLDGRSRKSEVVRSRAALDEALLRYRQVILRAAGDVENALVREDSLLDRVEKMTREQESARRVLEEAQRRYLGGASDYVPVFTSLRSTQLSERALLAVQRELLSNRVGLYRAMGGTWTEQVGDALDPRKRIPAGEDKSDDRRSTGVDQKEHVEHE